MSVLASGNRLIASRRAGRQLGFGHSGNGCRDLTESLGRAATQVAHYILAKATMPGTAGRSLIVQDLDLTALVGRAQLSQQVPLLRRIHFSIEFDHGSFV